TGPHPSADRRTRSDRRHPITTGDDPMIDHTVRVHRSEENLAHEDQLAWKMAEVAVDPVEVEAEVAERIINRVIGNATVAVTSLTRAAIVTARSQALSHPVSTGGSAASICGIDQSTSPESTASTNEADL